MSVHSNIHCDQSLINIHLWQWMFVLTSIQNNVFILTSIQNKVLILASKTGCSF